MRLLRSPLLHFLVLGALLWLAHGIWQQRQAMRVPFPDAATLARLEADWHQAQGRVPDAAQRAAILRAEIDRRMLVAEALRRGWHRRDPTVIRRLLQDARFLKLAGPPEQQIETAIALGLHRSDPVIARRLEERMRASVHPSATGATPHWQARQAAEQQLIEALRARYRVIRP